MRIAVLASGSSGNAIAVSSGGTSLLVDAGMSRRRTSEALATSGIDAETLAGILVTHEHSDHVSGFELAKDTFGEMEVERSWLA